MRLFHWIRFRLNSFLKNFSTLFTLLFNPQPGQALYSAMDPHNPGGPPAFPGQFLPPGFDINSLSPADREALLRRIQQYQQMQRARQQRPPFPPQMRPPVNGMMPMGAMPQMPQQFLQGPFIRPPGVNPQFFHNPYAFAPPVLPQVVRPPPNPQLNSPNAPSQAPPPHDDSIFASEGAFTEHLIRFLSAANFPEKRIPNIAGKPVQLLRLYQLICSVGGCANVASDLKKWQRIAAALQIPTDSVENLTMLRSTYLIFLYPYEQFYFQKKPLERIECKSDFFWNFSVNLLFFRATQETNATKATTSSSDSVCSTASSFCASQSQCQFTGSSDGATTSSSDFVDSGQRFVGLEAVRSGSHESSSESHGH